MAQTRHLRGAELYPADGADRGHRIQGDQKSIFTIFNYLLPEQSVMPMHCSANVGRRETYHFSSVCRGRQDDAVSDVDRGDLATDGWGMVFSTLAAAVMPAIRLSKS
jgi:phosphoenolpyruvate carboxykinase (ATP)